MTAKSGETKIDPREKFSKNLRLLQKQCEKYEGNDDYVYKLAQDISSKKDISRKWLVIMKKTKGTKTNEKRKGVFDCKYAKFRANELKVIKIINTRNPKLMKKHVKNTYDGVEIVYEINKITKSDSYDDDIEIVCSNGIHYFKTMITAYYYDIPDNYSGRLIDWYDSGMVEEEGEYLEGEQTGHWNYWGCDGNKISEGEYLNGNKNGYWVHWYNKKKVSDGNYLNGEKTGVWTHWHYNGEKESVGSYENGEKTGKWTYWSEITDKESEGEYKNGIKNGHWMYWDFHGRKKEDGLYINGIKSGTWNYWDYSDWPGIEKYVTREH